MDIVADHVQDPPAIHAAATAGSSLGDSAADPLEDANRQSYRFNDFLDRHLVRPAAMAYRRWLPGPVRTGVHNVLSNLGEPVTLINDVMQGHAADAGRSGVRFLANSTVGLAGVFDVAKHAGIAHHDNDFGVTLGRYHVPPGPYLYLPLVGPSNARDITGDVVDFFLDPVDFSGGGNVGAADSARFTLNGLDTRVAIDRELRTLNAMGFDPYIAIRSFYVQTRQSQIDGGRLNLEAMPDFPEEEPGADAAALSHAPQADTPPLAAESEPYSPAPMP